MAKTQMNVRVDESTARAARERALAQGVSVNRYIEDLVQRDAAEVGRTFVDAAGDFMKSYESVFAEELGGAGTGAGTGTGTGAGAGTGTGSAGGPKA